MTAFLALLLLQQAAVDQSASQVRCAVPFFRGAGTPEGATATMTTVSDGRPRGVMNWGVPTEGRNPAPDGRITQPPKHGTAMFVAPRTLLRRIRLRRRRRVRVRGD